MIQKNLHPRNLHNKPYDFEQLIKSSPELKTFVKPNKYGNLSIDFFDSKAVISLNKALLKHFYNIHFWEIPTNYLCPPVPGRADYIHYIADLLQATPKQKIKVLDIGIGANCIYPIIGVTEYNWSFIGTDIDPIALQAAQKIIDTNPSLKDNIQLRSQPNPYHIFNGIINKDDFFDVSICNPPFHKSLDEAQTGTLRKLSNLKGKQIDKPNLNFGGQNAELYCKGGEEAFIRSMIYQSQHYANNVKWFTTLVSKKDALRKIYKTLKKVNALTVKTIPMKHGNKMSRIVAWTFNREAR